LRGKEIFVKHCASCHKVADVGVQVGPDISDSRTQQPTQILTNILDPNRAIDNNYFRFIALTADDQVIEGMIAEETSDSIVLRGQNNVRNTLKRADLQELKATGVSLMPEGLESQIDHQAMADLISFVKNWRYLDGSIPK
jgi:putative heme-binding domain-containing protein